MIRKILPILGFLLILLFSSMLTGSFAQPTGAKLSSEANQYTFPSNITIVDTSSVPSLKIPSINTSEKGNPPTLPPFDPGKATPCNMTEVNAQRANSPIHDENHMVPKSPNETRPLSPLESNLGQYCIGINDWLGVSGVAATQWIDTSYTAPSSVCLYGPTLKCPKPCPLEVSTVYDGWHDIYMIGVWDFALESNDWAHYLYFDDAQNYISSYDGRQYYDVRTCRDGNGDWGVFLYNFGTSTWDEVYSESNDNWDWFGWDMYEAKWNLGTDWPPTLNIRSSNFQLYVPDLNFGMIWIANYWGNPYTFQNDDNAGALTLNGNYFGFYSSCDDWYAGAFYVQTINFAGWISGQGNAWDGDKLKGPTNDNEFARIYAGNYGDAGGITAKMVGETYGYIYVSGYALSGYYNSHLYCYVSQNGQNWNLVGGGPQTVNYWDGQHNITLGILVILSILHSQAIMTTVTASTYV